MTFLKDFPQLKWVRDFVRTQGIPVYLVGGFLRDQLLGRPCLDFDFAVEHSAIALSRNFAHRIKGAFVLLDQEHGCARVVKKRRSFTETYDFADFRGANLLEDLRHRDFTINTLACEMNRLSDTQVFDDVVSDPLNGIKDIKRRIIRMVSARSFREDPLRLLRAFSMRALLQFKIEAKTAATIAQRKNLIHNVSAERIRDELFKILQSDRAAENLKLMDKAGLLEQIMPQIAVMVGVRQGPYHHLDIWKHSLETVKQVEQILTLHPSSLDLQKYLSERLGGERTRLALLKLAALLHDIGKPQSLRKDKHKIYFYGHDRIGRQIVRQVAFDLKLSNNERRILQDMVLWHLRPGYLSNFRQPTRRALFRYFRDTAEESVSIALLSWADQRSARGPLTSGNDQIHHEHICRELIAEYFQRKNQKPFVRLINGHDLIRRLRLEPSPVFARILRGVEEQQITGKIKTKNEALAWARKAAARFKEK